MIHQLCRKLQASRNIFIRKSGILLENIFFGISCAQKFKNGLHGNPFASYNWLAVANGRVNGNSVIKGIHATKIIFSLQIIYYAVSFFLLSKSITIGVAMQMEE